MIDIHTAIYQTTIRLDTADIIDIDTITEHQNGLMYPIPNSNSKIMIAGYNKERIIQIYGPKSKEEAKEALETFREELRSNNVDSIIVDNLTPNNLAGKATISLTHNLEDLFTILLSEGYNIEYEPEQFAALIIKCSDPNVTFSIFSTGTVMVQGLSDWEDLDNANDELSCIEEYAGLS